jgi:hypothetical protein
MIGDNGHITDISDKYIFFKTFVRYYFVIVLFNEVNSDFSFWFLVTFLWELINTSIDYFFIIIKDNLFHYKKVKDEESAVKWI